MGCELTFKDQYYILSLDHASIKIESKQWQFAEIVGNFVLQQSDAVRQYSETCDDRKTFNNTNKAECQCRRT